MSYCTSSGYKTKMSADLESFAPLEQCTNTPLLPPAPYLSKFALAPPPPPPPSSSAPPCSGPPPPTPPSLSSSSSKGTPSKLSPAALKGVKPGELTKQSSEEMVSSAIKRFCNFNSEYRCSRKQVVNHTVQPQLQEGPQCGLVAVSMASQLVGDLQPVPPSQIFQFANDKGFTKQGEMFSARNLLEVCTTFMPNSDFELCTADVLDSPENMLADFLSDHIYLVPYDCDFSHGPCLEEGRKAHWALLTGCVLLSTEEATFQEFEWMSAQDKDKLDNLSMSNMSNKKMMLLGRQSKSLVLGMWAPGELKASNLNLKLVDDKRGSDQYVIPEEGLENSLANKMIKMKIK